MKKATGFLFFIILFIIGVYVALRYVRTYTAKQLSQTIPTPTVSSPTSIPTVSVKESTTKKSLFIPYWAIPKNSNDLGGYNTLVYFGVAANENGIDTADAGYKNLDTMTQLPFSGNKLLVLRMIDSKANFKILASKSEQQVIISQVVLLAAQKGFSGVVLDLEVSALPFDSLTNQITDFNTALNLAVKAKRLSYTIAIYGDTFYRIRPFNVKSLAKSADQVMIMAYDFTKANGNPGPTFPLKGRDTFGYDYESMLSDFLQAVPANKLTVVFGLFGYDWTVDSNNKAKGIGDPITAKEAENTYMNNCTAKACLWKRDDASYGIQITYTDKDGNNHVAWIDDMDAAKQKEVFLKQRNINNFSYWAYSYF